MSDLVRFPNPLAPDIHGSWGTCQTQRFETQVGELDDMTGWWSDQVAAAGFRSGDDKPKLGSSHLLHPHLSIRWAQQINYH